VTDPSPLNAKVVEKAVNDLAALKFFPEKGRVIAEIIGDMCSTDAQVKWLVREMLRRYDEWPGPATFRYVAADGFTSKDGLVPYEHVPFVEKPALTAGAPLQITE
jgi:hypothetical protein